MTEADQKIEAIKCVLGRRAGVLRGILDRGKNPYYEGKLDGYMQAINLLCESLDAIRTEA